MNTYSTPQFSTQFYGPADYEIQYQQHVGSSRFAKPARSIRNHTFRSSTKSKRKSLARRHYQSNMASLDSEEMENFQRLSNQYQPNIKGPLIGHRSPISLLVQEYTQANSDPTYVAKIHALAASHSSWRPIKGDGQCGWRATVYGYFETLLQLGDISLLMQEMSRLKSFEDTMRMAGIDYDILVDMFDYTWDLFDDIRQALERHDKSESVILKLMNDENVSNSIVYHFKMIASAFLQVHADQYGGFLEMSVEEFRATKLEPSNEEIEGTGLQLLTDAVIAPANIGLEVSYLDRSIGGQVTQHNFVPSAQGRPIIRLLYRIGHYDMVYQDNTPLQVYLQSREFQYHNMSEIDMPDDNVDLHSYMFPNTYLAYGQTNTGHHLPPNSLINQAPNPQNSFYVTDVSYNMSAHTPQPYFIPPPPQHMPLQIHHPQPQFQPSPSPHSLSSPSPASTSTSPATLGPPQSQEPQIRLHQNCYNLRYGGHESIALDPNAFGSSALSQAHFRNSDFQPQMWNAKDEYSKP